MRALGGHHAWIDGIHADVARSQLRGERLGDRVDGTLGGTVDGGSRRRQRAHNRADVDDASACGTEIFHSLFGGEDQAKYVQVELLVKQILSDGLNQSKLIDPGIVDEDVEAPKGLLRFR